MRFTTTSTTVEINSVQSVCGPFYQHLLLPAALKFWRTAHHGWRHCPSCTSVTSAPDSLTHGAIPLLLLSDKLM